MKFSQLASYLEKLEKTSSRLEITRILTDLLQKTDKNEIQEVVYLSLGVLAPNYEGIVLNIAEKMAIKSVSLAFDTDLDIVTKLYKKSGDIGNTAQELNKKKESEIDVLTVFSKLKAIANDSGGGSQERKVESLAMLFRSLDSLSIRFVARIPVGRLRLGFSEKTVIDALAGHDLKIKKAIEAAYNIRPDIGYIAKLVKEKKIKEVTPALGVPVVPILCQRLNSPSEMVKKMGEVSVEPKFDGLRIFIHFKKPNFIRIFTRNMNSLDPNIFPELKEIGKHIKADSIILDTEAVGLDTKREGFVDFQKTIQRRRKHDVAQTSETTPLQFQAFDVIMVNGKSLINTPYRERRKQLEEIVVNGGILRVDENTVTKDPEVIRELHKKYLKMGLEGVVVKKAESFYISGRTGWNWVKMKETEGTQGKLPDTIDCIVMGYTQGKGKRSGFGIGQFLAGIKDKDKFKTITKVGTGLTDEQFRQLNQRLKKIQVNKKPKEYEVHKDLTPDFWVIPELVVELAADEITKSPKHTAGLALRFPRLVGFRDDKKADQTTTLEELSELGKLQKS